MTKTKKYKKKTPKDSKKMNRRHKSNKANKFNQNYINFDSTEVIYDERNKSPKRMIFKMNGNYNGNDAKINLDFNIDGKQTKKNIKLSNDQLIKLIGSTDVVSRPIHQRLFDDFPMPQQPQIMPIVIHSGDMPVNEMTKDEMIIIPSMMESIATSNKSNKNKRSKKNRKANKV